VPAGAQPGAAGGRGQCCGRCRLSSDHQHRIPDGVCHDHRRYRYGQPGRAR
jgi:amt: ammonium transporter